VFILFITLLRCERIRNQKNFIKYVLSSLHVFQKRKRSNLQFAIEKIKAKAKTKSTGMAF